MNARRFAGSLIVSIAMSAILQGSLHAQTANTRRPHLGPIVPSLQYQAALQRGTRAANGAPGARYWQNSASYKINARIAPETRRLTAEAQIVYRNNSPDTLHNLHIDLTQNFHRAEAARDEEAEITGGVELRRVAVDGFQLRTSGTGPRYQVTGTRLAMLPPRPLAPGGTVTIAIDYAFTIAQKGASGRMGYSRDNFLYLAYWYPQMAVYDDVVGWHPDQFKGTTEFYAGFASYEYTVDVPAGWVVMGTGNLVNAQQVLAPDVYQRLQHAEASDTVVRILTRENLSSATTAGVNGRLQWRFAADSVRDVAFSVTRASLWDGLRTPVGDRDGDGKIDYTRIDAFYRESAPLWREVARYAAHAITFHSRNIGIPYPWPHMTAVEGEDIITGGMEYPMMTLMGSYNTRGAEALYAVTTHELAHMWFPMIVSNDERRYTWMDEGTTSFNEDESERDFWKPAVAAKFDIEDQEAYLDLARAGAEGEIMRRSGFHYPGGAYGVASYDKPASALMALRAVLGDDVFYRAYRAYAQRWKYKHPYPWDMWNTFENVSGRDLDWFWQAWYNTTWVLDHAVASVTTSSGTTTITVQDLGQIPMPVSLTITRDNGETVKRAIAVETWLNGATSATVTVPGSVRKVELDAERAYADINRSNNVWQR